jgi:hypothetical protein
LERVWTKSGGGGKRERAIDIASHKKRERAIDIASHKKRERAIDIALASRLSDHSKLKV